MNKQQRLLAVAALVASGVSVTVAIEQSGSSEAEVQLAVIDAAVVLREMGRSPEQVVTEVAAIAGVPSGAVLELVERSTLADDRDPRAVRSVDLAFVVPPASIDQASSAMAQAYCVPLIHGASHELCLSEQGTLSGEVTPDGVIVRTYATPSQAERYREALAGIATELVFSPPDDPNMSGDAP